MPFWSPPPETGMGPGGAYENAEAVLHQEEAQGDEARLAYEAEEANGGTPLERLWRRVRGKPTAKDPAASED